MQPSDLEIQAELEAIDATLAGEAVDPEFAELAELSLLLAADPPRMTDDFARELDRRVARRFAAPKPAAVPWWRPRRVWSGALAAGVAAVITGVVLTTASSSPVSENGTAGTPVHAASGASSAASTAKRAPVQGALGPNAQTLNSYSPAATTAAPTPPSNGRKQIQSAQLQLTATNSRIDTVAQELFDVVGQESGIVQSSNITSSSANGYATFSLSIPSGNLSDTLTRLSTLRYARVASRTDATQDVNNEYQADVRRLADARALRTSLLKQLAAAVTIEQVTSLTARIHDAEASISSDEATLRGLQHHIAYSSLSVQVNAAPPIPVQVHSSSGGFTIGHGAHDALRVLTVAAGVALIVLAALIPLGLLVALGAWIAYWIRRRRREQALDTA